MFLEGLINRTSVPILEKLASFTEARQRMLADNIANIDTPGFRTRHLSMESFQNALQEASRNRATDPSWRLEFPDSSEFDVDTDGFLRVFPTLEGRGNILFHDHSNQNVEQQMSLVAKNAYAHNMAVELLRHEFNGLTQAVRQRA
jgi:flagellar basal-body rod protein FlgB